MYSYLFLFLIIFLALLLFFGFYRFQDAVSKEKDALFHQYPKGQKRISKADLKHLPKPLSSYLEKVGVIGKFMDGHVSFRQQGRIKTKLEKGWTNFRAIQYMTARSPNFLWSAQAFPLFIRDKSVSGKGEVKINLFGLKNLAIFHNQKTDESALARCVGELVCYPVGFLSKNIAWETINERRVKALVQFNGTCTEGIFHFNEQGLITHFQTQRYKDESLEKFTGIVENYKEMKGLLIPSRLRAIWNLEEGDFEYFNATLTAFNLE